MSTASLIGDLMLSSYSAASGDQKPNTAAQLMSSLAKAVVSDARQQSHKQQQQHSSDLNNNNNNKASLEPQTASARSDSIADSQQQQQQSGIEDDKEVSLAAGKTSPGAAAASSTSAVSSPEMGHVRKTRSIGLEYPTYEVIGASGNTQPQQQQQQNQPSRATQINNLVDLMSDSYIQNKVLFNFVMNRVGLSQAIPYVEKVLGDHQATLVPSQWVQ